MKSKIFGDLLFFITLGVLVFVFTNVSPAKTPEEQCSDGDPDGCFVQASLFFSQSQKADAMVFYQKACEGGHMDGCFFLGHRAETKSKERNFALKKLTELCDQEKFAACTHLGNISLKDNNKEGIKALKKACHHGEVKGCSSLGYHAKKEGDMKTATDAFKKACARKDANACRSLKDVSSRN